MRRDGDRRRGEGNSISPLSEERGSLSSSSSFCGFLLKLSSSPSPLTSQFQFRQSSRRERKEARTEKLPSGLSTSIFFPGRTQ